MHWQARASEKTRIQLTGEALCLETARRVEEVVRREQGGKGRRCAKEAKLPEDSRTVFFHKPSDTKCLESPGRIRAGWVSPRFTLPPPSPGTK